MKQAIIISFLSATNTRGARLQAKSYATRLTIPFDYNLTAEGRIRQAVDTHNAKCGWTGAYVIGTLSNGDYCAVFTE